EHLLRAPAQDPLGGAVPECHPPIRIDGDGAVARAGQRLLECFVLALARRHRPSPSAPSFGLELAAVGIASRMPASGLWDLLCYRGVASGRRLAAHAALGRRCPTEASSTRLADYSNLYLRVTPRI